MPVHPPISQTPLSPDSALLGPSVPGSPAGASLVPYAAAPISHSHATSQSPLIPKGFGGMLQFGYPNATDGAVGFATTSELPTLNTWTLEWWASTDWSNPEGGFMGISTQPIVDGLPGNAQVRAGFILNFEGSYLFLNGVGYGFGYPASGDFWMALSCDGNVVRVYANGILQGTAPAVTILPTDCIAYAILQSGPSPPGSYSLDEIRFSNVARYTSNSYTVPTTPFNGDSNTVSLWHLDDIIPEYQGPTDNRSVYELVPGIFTQDATGNYDMTLFFMSNNEFNPAPGFFGEVSTTPGEVTNELTTPFFVQMVTDAAGNRSGGGILEVVQSPTVAVPTVSTGVITLPPSVPLSAVEPQDVGVVASPGTTGSSSDAGHVHVDPILALTGGANKSALFDGSTGELNTPYTAPAVTTATLMAWVNLKTIQGAPTAGIVGFANANLVGLSLGVNAGYVYIYYQDGQPVNYQAGATTLLTVGNWFLLVGTINVASGASLTTADMQVFINGTLPGQNSYSRGTAPVAPLASGATETVGYGYDGQTGAVYVNADLAHVAYWDTVLTNAQILALYNNASSMTFDQYSAYIESLSPLTYYPLNEKSGTTAENLGSTGSTDNGTYSGGVTLDQPGPVLSPVGIATTPTPPASLTLTSGTPYQNTTGGDVILRIPVTYAPTATVAATLAVGVGNTNTPLQVVENSEPAAGLAGKITTTEIYVPANWYVLLTTTNATINTGTVTPV